MIEVFTLNKNGKIELTKEELKSLLDRAYWEGRDQKDTVYCYRSPYWTPYGWSITSHDTNLSNTATNATQSATTKITLTSNNADTVGGLNI